VRKVIVDEPNESGRGTQGFTLRPVRRHLSVVALQSREGALARSFRQGKKAVRVSDRPLVQEIGPKDAWAVANLERKLLAGKQRNGFLKISKDLMRAEKTGSNISMGMFVQKRLVGYILAYAIGTDCDGSSEQDAKILLVNDWAILPQYRHHTYLAREAFFSEMRRLYPHRPLEAFGSRFYLYKWMRNRCVFERLGYRLSEYEKCDEDLYCVRWELAARGGKSRKVAPKAGQILKEYHIGGRIITVQQVSSIDDWTELESDWNRLVRITEDSSVFHTFEFQRVWWDSFGLSRRLFILAVRYEGEIIGVAPLQLSLVNILGRYFNRMEFIGDRWEMNRPKFLFPREHIEECLIATVKYLEESDEWDCFEAYEQNPNSPSTMSLEKAFGRGGYFFAKIKDYVCPYMSFDTNWEAFLASKSQRFRKNLKAARRKLSTFGRLKLSCHEQWPEVGDKLEVYKQIEDRSNKKEKQIGIARDKRSFLFFHDLARVFGKLNQFRLYLLKVDENPVAGTFGLEYDDKYYSLQIAHDKAFNRCSPGTLLESMEMEQCFRRGYKEYDFLGGYLNNKLRWTSRTRDTVGIYIFRKTIWLGIYYLAFFVIKIKAKDLLRKWGLMDSMIKLQKDAVACGKALKRLIYKVR